MLTFKDCKVWDGKLLISLPDYEGPGYGPEFDKWLEETNRINREANERLRKLKEGQL